ncbi:MAG TPA: 50S ribosomal protein L15 [Patescibacteria group bacterium]|nr:50S ribosomal protein L15 [Patescibacteria group bacterium]
MDLSKLNKTTDTKLRRLGQGHGSGRGKTAGRGTKGQKARNTVGLFFEGGALPLTKRLPFLRGRGRNKVIKKHMIPVDIKLLSKLSDKAIVDVETLIKSDLVSEKANLHGVKIIGNSEVSRAYEVKVAISAGARKMIESKGGKIS